MRKLIIFAVLGYLGYTYYTGTLELPLLGKRDVSPVISNDHPSGTISVTQASIAPPRPIPALQSSGSSSGGFRCDGRQHCSQMRSYEEALFFIRNCPNTKMDGDGDGEPCERQF